MNLLHITATHLNPTGGIPVVLKELVEAQNKIKNFTARVLSLNASVESMNSSYFDNLKNNDLNSYLDEFKPDFVIFHSFFFIDYNRVVNELLKRKIPYYIEPHGSFGKAAMNKSKIKKFIAVHTIFRKQLKNAFGYIFLNNNELQDSIFRTENDLIIPNGINVDSIRQNLSIYEKANKKNVKFYFIGRFDINHKGLDFLFDALDIIEKQKKSVYVSLFGKGEDKAEIYIRSRVKNYKKLIVEVKEPIYGNQKDDLLEQYGIMILTSRYEGFPMTVLEALVYGNPCLVTQGTNVADIVKSNGLGWVTETKPSDISNMILKAIDDYSQNSEQLIKNCKDFVAKEYSWEKIANESYYLFLRVKDHLDK